MNLLTIKNGYKPSNFKWSTNKKYTDIDILNNGSTARLLGNRSGIEGLLSDKISVENREFEKLLKDSSMGEIFIFLVFKPVGITFMNDVYRS